MKTERRKKELFGGEENEIRRKVNRGEQESGQGGGSEEGMARERQDLGAKRQYRK